LKIETILIKGKGNEKKTEERIMKERKRVIAVPLGVYCYSVQISRYLRINTAVFPGLFMLLP
jgi:hypothetical protein